MFVYHDKSGHEYQSTRIYVHYAIWIIIAVYKCQYNMRYNISAENKMHEWKARFPAMQTSLQGSLQTIWNSKMPLLLKNIYMSPALPLKQNKNHCMHWYRCLSILQIPNWRDHKLIYYLKYEKQHTKSQENAQ